MWGVRRLGGGLRLTAITLDSHMNLSGYDIQTYSFKGLHK